MIAVVKSFKFSEHQRFRIEKPWLGNKDFADMHVFDRPLLNLRLEKLDPRCQAIFALSCAERLMPLYKAFRDKTGQGDWEYLSSTLDRLWNHLLEGTTVLEDEFLANYDALVPGDDMPREVITILDPLAENAILALAAACMNLMHGGSEQAVWAANQAYEAADYMTRNLEGVKFTGPDEETAILQCPIVQSELGEQLGDLAELEERCHGGKEVKGWALAAEFRGRARSRQNELRATADRLPSMEYADWPPLMDQDCDLP